MALARLDPRHAHTMGRIWARLVCGTNLTRVSVHGLEHIRDGQAYVIMSNHQSFFDVWAFYSRFPLPFRWVLKEELRRMPFLGPSCARMGCVFVDRKDRAKSIQRLRDARPLFEQGISLMIFPEGTRSADGHLQHFKKGGFHVALDAGLPILPVTIIGSRRLLPARSLRPLPGGHIRIQVHPPVETEGYSRERMGELVEAVRSAIGEGLALP